MARHMITAQAPAKLNLALSVGPAGDGGWHPICSWMVTVDLVDELQVTRLDDDRLSRYAILWHREARRRTDIDWSITKDLAVRAHLALQERVGRQLPVQLKLEKRIPVGGGLGGGSSDAAAMLRAVNDLFDLDLSAAELAVIGAAVGADVPFLVRGGSAVVQGLGEEVGAPLPMPRLDVVLVFPEAQCPTGRVYEAFDDLNGAGLRPDAVRALAGSAPGRPPDEGLFNDLAVAAMSVAPELEALRARLEQLTGRSAHVSGSGSTLFLVGDEALHAEALAEAVERELELPAVAVAPHVGAAVQTGP